MVTAAEDGKALPGVTVIEKGSQNATFTDLDGRYKLNVAGNEAELVFSFIGYTQQVIAIAAQTEINIQLAADVA